MSEHVEHDPETGEILPVTEPPPAKSNGRRKPRAEPAGVPLVYAAISAVTAALVQTGIGKARRNQQQGYNFRGIDDVYNVVAPLLVEHRLVIVPRVEDRTVTERTTKAGASINYVTVRMTFDLICTLDGSRIQASSFGEAMDSGDKATNKALSTAYKYMAMQVFCIPTVGVDPEENTYEVAPKSAEEQQDDIARIADQKAGIGWTELRTWYLTLDNDQRLALRPNIEKLQNKARNTDLRRKTRGQLEAEE